MIKYLTLTLAFVLGLSLFACVVISFELRSSPWWRLGIMPFIVLPFVFAHDLAWYYINRKSHR